MGVQATSLILLRWTPALIGTTVVGACSGYHVFHGWGCLPLEFTLPTRVFSGALLGLGIGLAALCSIDESPRLSMRMGGAILWGTILGAIPWLFYRWDGPSGSVRAFIEDFPSQSHELHWLWGVGPPLTCALVLAGSIPPTAARGKSFTIAASGTFASLAALVHLGGWMYGDGRPLWHDFGARAAYHARAAVVGAALGVMFAWGRLFGASLAGRAESFRAAEVGAPDRTPEG